MIPFFAIVIIFNFFRFHGENNVAPDLLLYYKLLQHVTEDKNKGFYGLGQSAAHALRPFIKQCAHGSSLWNTHEVPGGKHHRLWHQTTWKHGRVRNLYYLIKHWFVGFFGVWKWYNICFCVIGGFYLYNELFSKQHAH